MVNSKISELADKNASQAAEVLQERLAGLLDLQLNLKHIHWNVVGPNFIAVHEMIDEHVASIREMTDDIAERIAILGSEPVGTAGHIANHRNWEEYSLKTADVQTHLLKLDLLYDAIIGDHRKSVSNVSNVDPVTEDLFIGQLSKLELYQWFVRSHLRNSAPEAKSFQDQDANATHTADRGPTPNEEKRAEETAEVQPDVSDSYSEMAKIGANVKGEGQIV